MGDAPNQPSQFDTAITDRTDELVEFGLPGTDERRKMIKMYMDKYLSGDGGGSGWSKKIIVGEEVDDSMVEKVVKETEGWSGRQISKLAIAWQSAAYGTTGATLSEDTFIDVLEQQKVAKEMKNDWLDEARAEKMAMDA
jgi:ATPase family AAA domain-containing protein 3A/B